ncbi:hypothetical protein H8E77_04975 [bacterium]|nr:hypothetical protein [bacterium]
MWDDVKEARWNDRQIISICSHVILNGTKWSEESQRFFASLRMTGYQDLFYSVLQ